MNPIKISRPFAYRFSTLLSGKVVSFSVRARKVAIGLSAVSITADQARVLGNTSDAYGDKFRLAVVLFDEHASA
jgi:hypothetical protein